jgi:hypothetical protein
MLALALAGCAAEKRGQSGRWKRCSRRAAPTTPQEGRLQLQLLFPK